MDNILLEINGTWYGFDKSSGEVGKIYEHLSSGRILKKKDVKALTVPDDNLENNIIKNASFNFSNTNNSPPYYEPTKEEVEEFIRSQDNYRHGVKTILSFYNDQEIIMDHNDSKSAKLWQNTRHKIKRIRRNISKTENGTWVDERVSKAKEYIFINDDGQIVQTFER